MIKLIYVSFLHPIQSRFKQWNQRLDFQYEKNEWSSTLLMMRFAVAFTRTAVACLFWRSGISSASFASRLVVSRNLGQSGVRIPSW